MNHGIHVKTELISMCVTVLSHHFQLKTNKTKENGHNLLIFIGNLYGLTAGYQLVRYDFPHVVFIDAERQIQIGNVAVVMFDVAQTAIEFRIQGGQFIETAVQDLRQAGYLTEKK